MSKFRASIARAAAAAPPPSARMAAISVSRNRCGDGRDEARDDEPVECAGPRFDLLARRPRAPPADRAGAPRHWAPRRRSSRQPARPPRPRCGRAPRRRGRASSRRRRRAFPSRRMRQEFGETRVDRRLAHRQTAEDEALDQEQFCVFRHVDFEPPLEARPVEQQRLLRQPPEPRAARNPSCVSMRAAGPSLR